MLTLIYLIALGGADNQAKTHIRGNLNQQPPKAHRHYHRFDPLIGYPKA
ncbi:hypothetical protein [Helicobacter labacensis]|nr:hypothetical protein [Helicobacter labacensis]